MKIGLFTLNLAIPQSGIPITVTRTYDSRIEDREDFGIDRIARLVDLPAEAPTSADTSKHSRMHARRPRSDHQRRWSNVGESHGLLVRSLR